MGGAPNTHVCRHPRRTARHEEAVERANLRGLLSPSERARLAKLVGRAS